MKAYVQARLADVDRSVEWREVEADDLMQAVKIVEQEDDVEVVLEASWEPGLQDAWVAENKSMAVDDDAVPLIEREWTGNKDTRGVL